MGAIMVLGKKGYVEIRGNIYKVEGIKNFDKQGRRIDVERKQLPYQGLKKDGRKLYSVKLFEPGAIYEFVEITKNNRVYRHFELVRDLREDAIEIEKITPEEVAEIFLRAPSVQEGEHTPQEVSTIIDSSRVFLEVLETNLKALRKNGQLTKEIAEFLIAKFNAALIEVVTEALLADPDFKPHLEKIEELLLEGDYNDAVTYAKFTGISLAQELGVEEHLITDSILRAVKKLSKEKRRKKLRGRRSRRKDRKPSEPQGGEKNEALPNE